MDFKESQDDSESAVTTDESEEESEIDEEVTESRRLECVQTIKDLESQFTKLKEELIQEKLKVIETKLYEIENETAKEFLMPINKLKENMDLKSKVASLLRDYRLKNVEHTFVCDEKSAQQSFETDKAMLFETTKSKIENEIKEIEENRRLLYLELKKKEDYYEAINGGSNHNSSSTTATTAMATTQNTTAHSSNGSPITSIKRKNQQKFQTTDDFERKKKPVNVTGPYVVYSLPEWDILEDWSIIKRGFDTNKRDDLSNTHSEVC